MHTYVELRAVADLEKSYAPRVARKPEPELLENDTNTKTPRDGESSYKQPEGR